MIVDVTQLTTEATHYPENHATIYLNPRNRVVVDMDDGWVFYDERDLVGFEDEDGNPRDPLPEEYSYYRYGVFSSSMDFTKVVAVNENDVPANQIFGLTNHETI